MDGVFYDGKGNLLGIELPEEKPKKAIKEVKIKPVLTRKCKSCGKVFTAVHPKDPQEYCEECRKENRN